MNKLKHDVFFKIYDNICQYKVCKMDNGMIRFLLIFIKDR